MGWTYTWISLGGLLQKRRRFRKKDDQLWPRTQWSEQNQTQRKNQAIFNTQKKDQPYQELKHPSHWNWLKGSQKANSKRRVCGRNIWWFSPRINTPQTSKQHQAGNSAEHLIATPPQRHKRAQAALNRTQQNKSERQCTPTPITKSDESLNFMETSPAFLSSKRPPFRQKRTTNHQKIQKANKYLVSPTQETARQNPGCPKTNSQIGSCLPNPPYPVQYYVSPNDEETSMTIKEGWMCLRL